MVTVTIETRLSGEKNDIRVAGLTLLRLDGKMEQVYLDTDPATIRSMAHDCPEKLGFKVVVLGKRVCIPIMPFVMTMTGANYETVEKRCA